MRGLGVGRFKGNIWKWALEGGLCLQPKKKPNREEGRNIYTQDFFCSHWSQEFHINWIGMLIQPWGVRGKYITTNLSRVPDPMDI